MMETAVLVIASGVISYAAMRWALQAGHRQHLPDIAPPHTVVLASRADADIVRLTHRDEVVYMSKEQ